MNFILRVRLFMMVLPKFKHFQTFYGFFPLCLAFFLLCLRWVQGESAYFFVHDFLEIEAILRILASRVDVAFFPSPLTEIPQVLGGVPRVSLFSGTSVMAWVFKIVPPIYAVLVLQTLIHGLAYLGAYLVARHFDISRSYASWIGFYFFLILVNPMFGLSSAGIPLLFWVLSGTKSSAWGCGFLFFAFGLFSSLYLSGVFVAGLLAAYILFTKYKRGRWDGRYIWSFVGLCGGYLLQDYMMIYTLLTGAFVSHRVEYQWPIYTFGNILKKTWILFLKGNYHLNSHHEMIILGLLGWGVFYKKWPISRLFWVPFLSILSILCLYALFLLNPFGLSNTPLNWSRIYVFLPFCWLVLLIYCVQQMAQRQKTGICMLFLGLNTLWSFGRNPEFVHSTLSAILPYHRSGNPEVETFAQFYDEAAFLAMHQTIGKPFESYRVGCVGFAPAKAWYIGMYTIDGYVAYYPLERKHAFRTMIAEDLALNPTYQRDFDHWGNRCYLYYNNQETESVFSPHFNTGEYASLGVTHFISTKPLKRLQENRLVFVQQFPTHHETYFLYKVIP